ncbi:MAG: hypothetical protein J6A15_09520 [Clostridia bacterium]|nr:hypothetical protein [Clostridia bacterium]
MKNSKLFQALLIIIIGVAFIYVFFIHNRANTQPVSAYVDETMYEVYTGKDVYEYYRTTLSDTEKIVYDEIKESYLQFKTELSTQVSKLSRAELKRAFTAVVLDHPEIFWIDSYAATINILENVNTNKLILLKYHYSEAEAIKVKEKIEPEYNRIIQEANKYSTDYEKIKFVHDELIRIGEYAYKGYSADEEGKYQSMVSIFETGDTVCAGFAQGFKFIMDNLGIKAISVENINEEEPMKSHVWNMVKVDDAWLNMDITWDYDLTEEEVSYKYFLIDNDTFYLNHKIQNNIPNK